MQPTAPSELRMWQKQIPLPREQPSDAEINQKYESGEQRIVTESNREKLPTFVEAPLVNSPSTVKVLQLVLSPV